MEEGIITQGVALHVTGALWEACHTDVWPFWCELHYWSHSLVSHDVALTQIELKTYVFGPKESVIMYHIYGECIHNVFVCNVCFYKSKSAIYKFRKRIW